MHILVIAPIVHLATMPTGSEAIRLFAERGYNVDVLALKSSYHPPFASSNARCKVKLITLPDNDIGKLWTSLVLMPAAIKSHKKANRYDAIIALSQMGLIYAWWWRRTLVPIIYLSDEIRFGDEGRNAVVKLYKRILKWLEIQASRCVAFSIIQDEERADILAEVNHIKRSSIMILPNSRTGKAERLESQYLQERFHIPKSSVILLSVGMITPYFYSLELVEEATKWPSNFKLVLHNRYNPVNEPYFNLVKGAADSSRTMFSLNPVPFTELDQLVSSAHIGLALYADAGPNITSMGKASGKLNTYLKNGLPAIVQDFPSLRWVERDGCGVCVSSEKDVLQAAQKILGNYDTYSENAIKAYNRYLSLDTYFERVASKTESAIRSPGKQ